MKRHVDPTIAFRLLGMKTKLDRSQCRDLALQYHTAFGAICDGSAKEEHASTLACTANVALILCEQGIGLDCLPIVHQAQEAIVRMMARGEKTKRYGFDGPGLQAVRDLLTLHDQQIEECTREQMTYALQETRRRILSGQVLETA